MKNHKEYTYIINCTGLSIKPLPEALVFGGVLCLKRLERLRLLSILFELSLDPNSLNPHPSTQNSKSLNSKPLNPTL